MVVTISYVRSMLDEIRDAANAGEDDVAHALEDTLHLEVLETVSRGELSKEDASKLASEALESGDIEFSRGCER